MAREGGFKTKKQRAKKREYIRNGRSMHGHYNIQQGGRE